MTEQDPTDRPPDDARAVPPAALPASDETPWPAAAPEGQVRVVDRRRWAGGASDSSAAGERSSNKPTYVEELERRLADKDEELRTTITRYREASAEFDEARVRFRRDVAKEVERGRRATLVELLDVVDNFDRAIDAARRSPGIDALLQGVEMVRAQFLAKLGGFGVTRVDPTGLLFDPARHEAATLVPTVDPAEDGRIVGVVRQGYEIGGEVLRPATVAVATHAGDAASLTDA
jgi:molecular chaperone GrpE